MLLFRKVRKNKKIYPSDFLFGQQRATERNKKDVAIILCRDAGNHAFEKKGKKESRNKSCGRPTPQFVFFPFLLLSDGFETCENCWAPHSHIFRAEMGIVYFRSTSRIFMRRKGEYSSFFLSFLGSQDRGREKENGKEDERTGYSPSSSSLIGVSVYAWWPMLFCLSNGVLPNATKAQGRTVSRKISQQSFFWNLNFISSIYLTLFCWQPGCAAPPRIRTNSGRNYVLAIAPAPFGCRRRRRRR